MYKVHVTVLKQQLAYFELLVLKNNVFFFKENELK